MNYTVSRKTWARGEGGMQSYLRRSSDGRMCCLGFVAVQSGIPKNFIQGLDTPVDCESYRRNLPKWLFDDDWDVNSPACDKAMDINDSKEKTDQEREAELAAIFAKNGDTLTFTD